MDICFTYILEFPNGKSYVGVSNHPHERLRQHAKRQTPCGYAIRKYGYPQLVIVCQALRPYCMEIENKLTYLLNSLLPNGYNQQHGGTGGSVPSEETRKKMSIARGTRASCSEETRKRLSIAGKRPCSKKTKIKISIANKGKVHTQEAKERMSVAAKNRSDECKKNIANTRIGRKHSEETKKQMSIGQKARRQQEKDKKVVS